MRTKPYTVDEIEYCPVVSEATLRPVDLIYAFGAELEYETADYDKLARDYNMPADFFKRLDDGGDLSDDESDAVSMMVDEMIDDLTQLAPKGFYFGGHMGDPACFGFWLVEDDPEPDDDAYQRFINPTEYEAESDSI